MAREFRISSWTVTPDLNRISDGDRTVSIEPQVMEVLVFLADHPGEVLSKDQILKEVWRNTFVGDEVLTYSISELRKALGDDAKNPRFIATIHRRGYRLIVPVERNPAPAPPAPEPKPRAAARARWIMFAVLTAIAAMLLVIGVWYFRSAAALGRSDAILIGDIANETGDPVFEDVLESALATNLEQSPFLNLISRERTLEVLRSMNRSPDERVTPAVAREICQRGGIKAFIAGSIVRLGRNYVLSLEAVIAATGESIAREQVEVDAKEKVLQALGQASARIRRRLGESLASIHKYDTPLVQATTSSLEAFKAYAIGQKLLWSGRWLDAIAHYRRAVGIDPDFASAYDDLSYCYAVARKRELANEAAQRAFDLRGRVSEYERGSIEIAYYNFVTGEIDKSIAVAEAMRGTYPRNVPVLIGLGEAYSAIGQLEKAKRLFEEAMSLGDDRFAPIDLAAVHLGLNNLHEAKMALGRSKSSDSLGLRLLQFQIASLEGDARTLANQAEWARGRPEEMFILKSQADKEAFSGKMRASLRLFREAIESARQREMTEAAADFAATMACTQALMGDQRSAAESATALLSEPLDWQSMARAGMALAISGKAKQAESVFHQVSQRTSRSTLARELFLPLLRACMNVAAGDGNGALRALERLTPYDRVSVFWTQYLRGQAFLLLRNGTAAAAEFRQILDNRCRGILSPLYPLAQVGTARAWALAGNGDESRKAYQDFLALWKEADGDLPVLNEARQELQRLR